MKILRRVPISLEHIIYLKLIYDIGISKILVNSIINKPMLMVKSLTKYDIDLSIVKNAASTTTINKIMASMTMAMVTSIEASVLVVRSLTPLSRVMYAWKFQKYETPWEFHRVDVVGWMIRYSI